MQAIEEQFFSVAAWEAFYENHPGQVASSKKVGIVLAGNLPAVGLHDVLMVLASGNAAHLKLSSQDKALMSLYVTAMQSFDSAVPVHVIDRLQDMDAVIATGSDFSGGYLEHLPLKIVNDKIISLHNDFSFIKADLSKQDDQKLIESPSEPVEKITLVTMGHEPDLKGTLEKELSKYKIDIEIIDLLRSESKLEFKRDSEADIIVNKDYLEIKNFYPMNLLQKLSLESAEIDNWKQLVESIMVDFNFDGNVLNPTVTDIPEKNKYVVGKYKIPVGTKKIKIKITDLISESFEKEIEL
jgi:hypothetical protein